MTTRCHCGQPLHYRSPTARAAVDRLIADLGECIVVTCGDRSWRVPRHYIALHGIVAAELPTLGFEEIRP